MGIFKTVSRVSINSLPEYVSIFKTEPLGSVWAFSKSCPQTGPERRMVTVVKCSGVVRSNKFKNKGSVP